MLQAAESADLPNSTICMTNLRDNKSALEMEQCRDDNIVRMENLCANETMIKRRHR